MTPKPRQTARHLAIVTAMALTLARCGGERTPSIEEISQMDEAEVAQRAKAMDDLSSLKACELLTAAEIQSATGLAPGPPQDMTQLDGQLPMCQWPSADGSRTLVNVLISRSRIESYEEFVQQAREELGEDFSTEEWQRVDDVRGVGIWLMELGMLQIHDDGRLVQVATEPAGGRDNLQASKDLALTVFGRLH